MNEKITINPEQFALNVLAKDKPIDTTNEAFIKENLLLYLEAIVAANKFNDLENHQFSTMKENEIRQIISDILGARLNA